MESPAEERRRRPVSTDRLFPDVRFADGVEENDLVAMAVLALVMGPRSGQRAVRPAVSPPEPWVVKSAGLGIRPAGTDRISELHDADDPGVNLVPAIEVHRRSSQ